MKAVFNAYDNEEVFDLNLSDKKPVRPGLPLLLPFALFLWGCCAGTFTICSGFELELIKTIFLVGFGFVVFWFIVVIITRFRRLASLVCLACCIGLSLGAYGGIDLIRSGEAAIEAGEQIWEIELLEDSQSSSYGSKAVGLAKTDSGICCKTLVYFSEENDLLNTQKIRVKGSLKSMPKTSKQYYWTRGLESSISVLSYEVLESNKIVDFIRSTRRGAIHNFEQYAGDSAGILQALVCGYRNTINENGVYENFKICGLAHIVAVSGAHLAIVVSVFMLFLRKLRVPRKIVVAVSTAFVCAYLVFAGIPISAIRSAVMVILSLIASIAGRRAHPINGLSIAILAFVVIDPATSVSVSLFLSAASTLCIMLFCNLIASWFGCENKKVQDYIVSPTSLTLSSNIATLPFSVGIFSQLSTISILANVIATPLFSLACVIGLVCSIFSCIFPVLSQMLMAVAGFCAFPLDLVVGVMSKIPHACVALSANAIVMLGVSIVLVIVLWIAWPSFSLKHIAICSGVLAGVFVVVIFVAPRFESDEIVMLDVGQGDAILLRSENSTVLIDTGNQETKLKEGLAKFGVHTLDGVIITHSDDDHMGVLDSLSNFCEVKSVYSSKFAIDCECKNCSTLKRAATKSAASGTLEGLEVGDRVEVGNFDLDIVWPDSYSDEGGNADSLCAVVTSDINNDNDSELVAFFGGDAESEQMQKIIDEKRVGDIDILKVGHHGSKVSLSSQVLEAIKPEVALISCGLNNRYGHPKQETLDFLMQANSEVFRTDEQGSIIIKPKVDGYDIETRK